MCRHMPQRNDNILSKISLSGFALLTGENKANYNFLDITFSVFLSFWLTKFNDEVPF